jgi:hypothetical protein
MIYRAITVIALHSITVCEEGENLYMPFASWDIDSDFAFSVSTNNPMSTSSPPGVLAPGVARSDWMKGLTVPVLW